MGLWYTVCGIGALLLRFALALHFAGTMRSKNSAGIVMRSATDLAVAIISFWLIGTMVYTGRWTPHGVGSWSDSGALLFFLMCAMTIAPGIVTGVAAERSRFFPLCLAPILLCGVVAPLLLRWMDRGWLFDLGFHDAGRGSVVHLAGGACAAALALMVGARSGKYNRDGSSNAIPGHSVPLSALGAMLMFVMWTPAVLGFSPVADAGLVPMNVLLAGAAGMITSLLISQFRYGKPDVHLTLIGMLGGLVAITPAADVENTFFAVIIGAVAGFLVPAASLTIDLLWHIDDPTAGISIHAIGSAWGLIAAGLFVPSDSWGAKIRLIGIQLLGFTTVVVLALALSVGLFAALKAMVGLRAKEADEFDGLDLAEHDIGAYPDFQQTTIKSYHLREA
jgi:Amt family ammonium transporter